jgi:hypothetical protein
VHAGRISPLLEQPERQTPRTNSAILTGDVRLHALTVLRLGNWLTLGDGKRRAFLNEAAGTNSSVSRSMPDPSGNGYYPVYVDIPRGNAGYCAYHSAGTCSGVPVQFAFFWKLDGDAGCDPQDTSGLHPEGLAALSNVSGHELSEARTDPASPGAWYDSRGQENGDKCAWTFNVPMVTFSNATQWKIQGEWSNAAFTAGTGYPNSSGQKGCLDGR